MAKTSVDAGHPQKPINSKLLADLELRQNLSFSQEDQIHSDLKSHPEKFSNLHEKNVTVRKAQTALNQCSISTDKQKMLEFSAKKNILD